jgi:formylglycine-generating enzyme required for sulfatase activity
MNAALTTATATPAPAGWHWPHFAEMLCGTGTDQERLGLPSQYLELPLRQALEQAQARCRTASTEQLLSTLNTSESTLADRLACGNLLALAGDPRIRTLEPEMHDIPGGSVDIGLPRDAVDQVMHEFSGLGLNRIWIDKETPRHRVQLQNFRMARFPVTNSEYREFLLATGHHEIPSSWSFRQFPMARANHPVYTVSADAADAYTQWLARSTGRGFRLPSEAEWEWAASGPQQKVFPWGAEFDPALCNTAETGLLCSSSVGAFVGGESAFGLSDMGGNVEEYVADNYAAYPGGQWIEDHLVQIHGNYRVARGGSFARFRDLARNQRRHGHNPRSAAYAMGFRLAESI